MDIKPIIDALDGDIEGACYVAKLVQYGQTVVGALEFYRFVVSDLEECEDAFYAGNRFMLLEAIRRCTQYLNFPLPGWVREELEAALNRFKELEPDSPEMPSQSTLSGAFGLIRPKKFHIDAERRRQQKAWDVFKYILERQKEGIPLNDNRAGDGLFREAGKRYAISTITAKRYYYDVKHTLELNSQNNDDF